jgi:gluconate 5-dehydrogenase
MHIPSPDAAPAGRRRLQTILRAVAPTTAVETDALAPSAAAAAVVVAAASPPPTLDGQMFKIAGRVAVVTGASSGMGLSMADAFVAHGARVVYVGRRAELQQQVARHPPDQVLALQVDMASECAATTVVEATIAKWGRIDVLVNNAGTTDKDRRGDKVDPYAEGVFEYTLAVNLTGVMRLSKACADVMASQASGGSVINIGSVAAQLGMAGNPSYHASKGAVLALTRAMAADFGPAGVRFNIVHPGFIRTEMTAASFDTPYKREARTRRTFLKRWGEGADMAGCVLFLASDAAAYVTGAELRCDGARGSARTDNQACSFSCRADSMVALIVSQGGI